jgi:TonB family protein
MIRIFLVSLLFLSASLSACASKPFKPKSYYPPDPWVKGYADPDDCIGGEKLAAINFDLPKYPRRAFRTGRQGWVILRLDIDADGSTDNVSVERALPGGMFESATKKAARKWLFHPPKEPLDKCRVLIRYQLGAVSLGG